MKLSGRASTVRDVDEALVDAMKQAGCDLEMAQTAFVARLQADGIHLEPWQRELLDAVMERDETGGYRYRQVTLSPRPRSGLTALRRVIDDQATTSGS